MSGIELTDGLDRADPRPGPILPRLDYQITRYRSEVTAAARGCLARTGLAVRAAARVPALPCQALQRPPALSLSALPGKERREAPETALAAETPAALGSQWGRTRLAAAAHS